MQNEMMQETVESATSIHSLLLELISGSNTSQKNNIPYWAILSNELLDDTCNDQIKPKQMSKKSVCTLLPSRSLFENAFPVP